MSNGEQGIFRWKNRILGYDVKRADQFTAHPQNPRRHPQIQRESVKTSLNTLGWVGLAIENVQTGHLLDGHERVWDALELGDDTAVPYLKVDLDEDEELLFLATFDPITYMAQTDPETLSGIMAYLSSTALVQDNPSIGLLMKAAAEHVGLDMPREVPPEPPPVDPDRAEALRDQWQTEAGQLWLIPSQTTPGRTHRLLCADSTDADTWTRLMQGERWSMLMTDPPYNVDYGHKNRRLNLRDGGHRIQTAIEYDQMSMAEWGDFLRKAFGLMRENGLPGASFYVFGPAGENHLMFLQALSDAGMAMRHTIVWAKNNHVLGSSDYNYKHEPIAYGWLEGAAHRFYGAASETTLWEIDRPNANKLHPTMKPVALYQRAICNSSAEGEIVVDPFAGSGPMYVAAEQFGRVAYGCEITPEYTAVILEQLAQMGLEPYKAETDCA